MQDVCLDNISTVDPGGNDPYPDPDPKLNKFDLDPTGMKKCSIITKIFVKRLKVINFVWIFLQTIFI